MPTADKEEVFFPPPCLCPPPPPPHPTIRWGILGCATIALKISRSILLSPGCILTSVASRDPEKAKKFVDDVLGEKSDKKNVKICSYEEILDKSIVDVLYVPLPSKLHTEWVSRAAEKGIHILCEKPAAVNSGELKQMIKKCKANNVQFMDGVMYMHHQRTAKMVEIVKDQLFGTPNRVTAALSNQALPWFFEEGNIRIKPDGDPLGCVGDLAYYCVRMALLVFNMAYPSQVWCRADNLTDDGIPTDVTGEVFWDVHDVTKESEEKKARGSKTIPILTFQCSFIRPCRQSLEILGDRKRILMDDFVIPRNEAEAKMILEVFPEKAVLERSTKVCSSITKYRFNDCIQDCVMVQRMAEMVRKNMKGEPLEEYWFDAALITQVICDALMKSIKSGGRMTDVDKP